MSDAEMNRRGWLKLMGAGVGAAGLGACAREPIEKILPYTVPPPGVVPGVPRFYATSFVEDGFASGVLVESHEGRPTKIEGNPEHPASLGATSVHAQASILGLYDPTRARGFRRKVGPATWDAFVAQFAPFRSDAGAGLRFLLEPTSSPLVASLVGRVLERYPKARFTFFAPTQSGNSVEGARMMFGARLQPQHDIGAARTILSLDSDFLTKGPFQVRYARHFAERRRPSAPSFAMNRLYVVEAMLSSTGTVADHRLPRRPSEVAGVAASIAAELVAGLGASPPGMPRQLARALERFRPKQDRALVAIARDLKASADAAVVMAGERQPPVVHALANLIHGAVGAARTVRMTKPVLADAGSATQDLQALAGELAAGHVDTLVILGGDLSTTAPADLGLAGLVARVPRTVCLTERENETARATTWFVSEAHYLEAWGDARAYDGTLSIIQPLIALLHGGKTVSEVLAVFAGEPYPEAHRLLRDHWSAQRPEPGSWEEALRRGLVLGSAAPTVPAALRYDELLDALDALAPPAPPPEDALELSLLSDPCVGDGRHAHNPWLLELPQPLTKLTWGNAAMLGPRTAARLGADDGDLVELRHHGRTVAAPALVVPGHAEGVVSLNVGWGGGIGVDAYPLSTWAAPWFASGLHVRRLDAPKVPLARTQRHMSEEGREIAPRTTLTHYRQDPDFTAHLKGPQLSLYTPPPATGDQWAMTIDTSACTSCGACVIACQAENSVLVVGKDAVLRGREMHWLRIDTYVKGPPEAPAVVHQPMLCQHCEKAPCEYVCPVNATVHSPDGLNEMVYNRCVGTRFCSNNCPYKVRRFNWFDWSDEPPNRGKLVALQRNPEVSVRERGVMEKCTYCVQRIRQTQIAADISRRDLRQGEVVTACQQACPTQAIQFDSLRHSDSAMARWRREPRSYAVLHELGTNPRTMYLAKVDNPNPEMG